MQKVFSNQTMVEKELLENSTSKDELESKNDKIFNWPFFKHIALKYIVPVLVFVAAFLLSYIIFKKNFYTEYLVGDDAREYIYFSENGFFKYTWLCARPLTNLFMGLGFAVFGHYAPRLMLYACLFFGVMIAALFITAKKITNSTIISLFVIVLAIFSRLNWYFYATYFGVMESSSLTFMILSIYLSILFIKAKKKMSTYIILCICYMCSMLFHERYMFCFVPIIIISLIGWDTRKKKLLFALIPVSLFAIFLIYRFFMANSTPFVVTGKAKISLDIVTVLSNFWHGFISFFTLNETEPSLTGLINANLNNYGSELLVVFEIVYVILFVVGISLSLFLAFNKKYKFLSLGTLLAIYCVIMLAAGSVSPTRVEPRWIYSGFLPFVLFFGVSINAILEFFKQGDLLTDFNKNKNWQIKIISILAMLLAVFPPVKLSSYALENKQQYYIDDDISRTERYEEYIHKAMHKENKDKLYIVSDEYNMRYLNYTISQWDDIKEYTIISENAFESDSIDFDKMFVCVCIGSDISKPSIPTLEEAIITNYWVEGKTQRFYVYGSIDELYLRIKKISFANMPNNKVTIYNGSEIIVDKYEIDSDMEFFIPLKKNSINQIILKAGYTYRPTEHGGVDDRDLSLYIAKLGGLGEPINPTYVDTILSSYLVEGKSYSFYTYGSIEELYLKLNQTHFVDMPNNKVTIYNGSEIIYNEVEIDSDMEFFIPLRKDEINRITLVANYTYCSAEHGGSDIRDLSLFIAKIGGLGEPITPSLTEANVIDKWIDGKTYSFYAYGSLDELFIKLRRSSFANMPNNKVTIYNGSEIVVDKCEVSEDMEFFIPLRKNEVNRITLVADYTYRPSEHGGSDQRDLSLFICQIGGLGEPITPSLTEANVIDKWIDGKTYSFYAYGSLDELFIKLRKSSFADMPNNKVTIYNGSEIIVDKYEIDSDTEFFIPLRKDEINRITLVADYTYRPSEHGGSDQRDLSLFIYQIGGLGEPIIPSLSEASMISKWMEGKSYSFYVYGSIEELYLKLNQTHFVDMPNNKVTIYNSGEIIADKVEINKDMEFFIPLRKDEINRITLVADYTYRPSEHGGSDQRDLSLFIAQLGGSH